MAKEKISRKELLKSPDEFLTLSEKVYEYISHHGTKALIGAIGVVVIILLAVGFNWYRAHTAEQALTAYNQAATSLPDQANFEKEKAEAAVKAINDFLAEYPDSVPARYALLDLGGLYYRLEQYEKARDSYQKYLDGLRPEEKNIQPVVLDSLAYVYESMGKLEDAAATWNQVLALPGELMKIEAYLSLGRVNLALERPDKAEKAYVEVLTRYPETPQANLARLKLSELEK